MNGDAGGASSTGAVAGRTGRRRIRGLWWCMTTLWLIASFVPAASAEPGAAPASMDRYRCTICHAEHETLAGPAFADVAAKYAGDRLAVSKIARDIRSGVRSGAPWHMPPHPEVSPAVARTMARYIMSLSAGTPAPREAIPR